MLEFPEQDPGGAVQQTCPLPGLILHPDLVSAQRRLKRDFKKKSLQQVSSLQTESLVPEGFSVFSPLTLVRPHIPAPD